MQLPKEYFEYTPCDFPTGLSEYHTLRGFRKWVVENDVANDDNCCIEMMEKQFWHFTELQPIHAGEEKYWTRFNGVPIKCPQMTEDQQRNLGLWHQ
jgi:hypothetical protein